MPPLPAIKVTVLKTLEERLRGQPRPSVLRSVENAESLAADLDPAQNYPEDWLVFRITGVRPQIDDPSLVMGEAALRDLSAFIERLTDAAKLELSQHPPEKYIPASDLCERWHISRKTLDRLRRRGLVARRVVGEDHKPRIVVPRIAAERFEQQHADELAKAAAFSRISPELEKRIIRRAEIYHRRLNCSLNAAAERIAKRFGRSHEAIRQLLKRHDEATRRVRAGDPARAIFDDDEPLTQRKRAAALRAWRWGIDLNVIARKHHRTRSAVRRAVTLARAEKLWALGESGSLEGPTGPTFQMDGAREVLLAPAPVRSGLGGSVPRDLIDVLALSREKRPPLGVEESTRLIAFHFLRHEVAQSLGEINHLHPQAERIDQIETQLRWAARLKVELVRAELRPIIETVETRTGRRAEELPARSLARLITRCLHAAGEAVDHFDPFRGGRLAGAVGLACDRVVMQELRKSPVPPVGAGRAVPKIASGTRIEDWSRTLSTWQRWLEPDARLRAAAEAGVKEGATEGAIDAETAAYLIERYGWGGAPPRTLAELGLARSMRAPAVARLDAKAHAAAMAWARAQKPVRGS